MTSCVAVEVSAAVSSPSPEKEEQKKEYAGAGNAPQDNRFASLAPLYFVHHLVEKGKPVAEVQ